MEPWTARASPHSLQRLGQGAPQTGESEVASNARSLQRVGQGAPQMGESEVGGEVMWGATGPVEDSALPVPR